MFDFVDRVRAEVAAGVAGADARLLSGPDALRLLAKVGAAISGLEALKASLVARVDETNLAKGHGLASTTDLVADVLGVSGGEAARTVRSAKDLARAPEIAGKLADGTLSASQAAELAPAAVKHPELVPELLEKVERGATFDEVRDTSRRVRQLGEDQQARLRRIHDMRFLRTWTDADGAGRGEWLTTPDKQAAIVAAINRYAQRSFDAARKAGTHQSPGAYKIDGLADALGAANRTTDRSPARPPANRDAGGEPVRRPSRADDTYPTGDVDEPCFVEAPKGAPRLRTEIVIDVTAEALARGDVAHGETCHIRGIGDVPVATVRELLGDAFTKIVIRDGLDIRTVAHAGRVLTEHQRTAVLARTAGRCSRPGCPRAADELHHTVDYRDSRWTDTATIAALCSHDHDEITYRGAKLTGTHGHWTWTPAPNPLTDIGGVADGRPPPGPAPPPPSHPADRDLQLDFESDALDYPDAAL